MMRRTRQWRESFVLRMERVARDMNPVLVVIVIGLAVLNFSVYAALRLAPVPRHGSGWNLPAKPSTTPNGLA